MRVFPGLLVVLTIAALAACGGGGDDISDVTCGDLGIGGPGSGMQQNKDKLDDVESQIADEAGGEKVVAETRASGALIAACVREDDPDYKPGDEALEYVEKQS